MDAFAFDIRLPFEVDAPGDLVQRTIAVRADQTLEQLHEAMRLAFGWADQHLYSFWKGSRWWDETAERYDAPFDPEPEGQSARTTLAEIGVRKGSRFAYVFDFGDEWRAYLHVVDRWRVEEAECYPMLVEATGTPPPQYGYDEQDDEPPEGV